MQISDIANRYNLRNVIKKSILIVMDGADFQSYDLNYVP